MKIEGIAGLAPDQIRQEVERGGRFVIFQYCVSILILSFRRNTSIYFIRPGESAMGKGLPWTLLSLFLGWWGLPWGLIYTPMVLYTNLRGGKDVTSQILPLLTAPAPPSTVPQPGTWPPPPDFRPS